MGGFLFVGDFFVGGFLLVGVFFIGGWFFYWWVGAVENPSPTVQSCITAPQILGGKTAF